VRSPGSVIGEMSLLDNSPRSASVRALTPSHLLMISKGVFEQVLSTSPSAALATLHTFVTRLRQNEALLHEKEKMAGLGTLAAGLAHELNNPAAAVKRAVAQLRDLLTKWQPAMSALDRLELAPAQQTCLADLRETMAARAAAPVNLDPLTRSDREGEIEAWLDEHGVAGAWELAPTLVGFGWELADFENLAENFPTEHVAVIAESLGIGSAVHAVLEEVAMGSERISEIVKAVKSYSYLDRAPIQEVDVHDGLDNTLVILRHKLNKGSIQIIRDYDRSLPRIEAFAG
jgi:signal transduction histidine kinase